MNTKEKIIEISPEHRLYPESVADFLQKSPVVSAIGNLDLLQETNAIGFCGSRGISPKGIEATRLCVQQLHKEVDNVVIVSGNAAGADLEAHHSALAVGAKTILVLPEGIAHFRIRKQLREVWDWERVLVLSQFAKYDTWQVWRAMRRNYLILALSKALLVIEAQKSGGTKAAATAAIDHKVPLFAIKYEDSSSAPENERLLHSQKAEAIFKKRTGEVNISPIIPQIHTSRPTSRQKSLVFETQ